MATPVTVGLLIVQVGVAAVQPGNPIAPGKVFGTCRFATTPLAADAVKYPDSAVTPLAPVLVSAGAVNDLA